VDPVEEKDRKPVARGTNSGKGGLFVTVQFGGLGGGFFRKK